MGRKISMNLNWKRVLKSGAIGSIVGSVLLFFFGDGFLMAFYLAVEGAIIGFVVGSISGMVIAVLKGVIN